MLVSLSDVVAPAVLAREVVQARREAGVQALVGGGEGVVELLWTAGTDDRGGDDRILEHPGDGHLRHRHAGLGCERAQHFDRGQLALVPVALSIARAGSRVREARARQRTSIGTMLAREQAARDRVVRDHAQTFLGAEREELALDLAEEQVVARLYTVKATRPRRSLWPSARATW